MQYIFVKGFNNCLCLVYSLLPFHRKAQFKLNVYLSMKLNETKVGRRKRKSNLMRDFWRVKKRKRSDFSLLSIFVWFLILNQSELSFSFSSFSTSSLFQPADEIGRSEKGRGTCYHPRKLWERGRRTSKRPFNEIAESDPHLLSSRPLRLSLLFFS